VSVRGREHRLGHERPQVAMFDLQERIGHLPSSKYMVKPGLGSGEVYFRCLDHEQALCT